MVVAIFCGHPDNLEDSDESERETVAGPDSNTEPRAVATGSKHSCHRSRSTHRTVGYRKWFMSDGTFPSELVEPFAFA